MRKRFPSQIRYEKKNPLISFRLKKDEKSKIKLMADRSGKSVSELVRIALLDLEIKDIKKDGMRDIRKERVIGRSGVIAPYVVS